MQIDTPEISFAAALRDLVKAYSYYSVEAKVHIKDTWRNPERIGAVEIKINRQEGPGADPSGYRCTLTQDVTLNASI